MSRWPHVRAAILAGVLLVNGVLALPLPKSIKRSNFDQPVAVEEIEKIRVTLGKMGLEVTKREIVDFFVATGQPLVELRAAITAPTKQPVRLLGIGQSWGLFTYPDTYPHRLVVEARATGGAWERLYAGLDPDHDWHRDVLVYRRVRGVYDGNTTKAGRSWENLSRWVADRVFEERADVAEVKVFFERFHTVPPGGVQDPKVDVRQARTYFREAR